MKLIQCLLISISICFLAGCTTVSRKEGPAYAINVEIPHDAKLGANTQVSEEIAETNMIQMGVAKKVRENWTGTDIVTELGGNVFSFSVGKIYWYGYEKKRFKVISPVCRIQWFRPDGNLHEEKSFQTSGWLHKSSIKLNPKIKDQLLGTWRVRVWIKEQLIDDRYFKVV